MLSAEHMLEEDSVQQVQYICGKHFSMEVRFALSQWIENVPWHEVEPENPDHIQLVKELADSFFQEIEKQTIAEKNPVTKFKLNESAKFFRANYQAKPIELVCVIKRCLQTKSRAIHEICIDEDEESEGTQESKVLVEMLIKNLVNKTEEIKSDMDCLHQLQETYVIQQQDVAKHRANLQQYNSQPYNQQNGQIIAKLNSEKEYCDHALNQKATEIVHRRMALTEKFQDNCSDLGNLMHIVVDKELIAWKYGQQQAANGISSTSNLNEIQNWCESLAELLWCNRRQVMMLQMLSTQVQINFPHSQCDKLPTMMKSLNAMLTALVSSTFVVDKQPPQVLKTNTRFSATVRLLVADKLNMHLSQTDVKVTILSESLVNTWLSNQQCGDSSGEILNNTGTMEFHSSTRQLSVTFRNMQLKKIKRTEKKGSESVIQEKFTLLFQSYVKICGELDCKIWTFSLPLVVIVHGSQEPQALATVIWDNAFGAVGRVPFHVPDQVSWPQLANVINTKFKVFCGRGLTEDNLHFLASKVLRTNNAQDYTNQMITWHQFCRDSLPERSFTFWDWLYALLKVIKEHIKDLWKDGLIAGFISRPYTDELLKNCLYGTFLLRFSDSELGGVTIAWVDQKQQEKRVYMLQPCTSRDFSIRSLADRINDLKHLTFLFPNIPKDQAFGKYYTNESAEENVQGKAPYVKPTLVTQIPGWAVSNYSGSFPSSPVLSSHFYLESSNSVEGYQDLTSL